MLSGENRAVVMTKNLRDSASCKGGRGGTFIRDSEVRVTGRRSIRCETGGGGGGVCLMEDEARGNNVEVGVQ